MKRSVQMQDIDSNLDNSRQLKFKDKFFLK